MSAAITTLILTGSLVQAIPESNKPIEFVPVRHVVAAHETVEVDRRKQSAGHKSATTKCVVITGVLKIHEQRQNIARVLNMDLDGKRDESGKPEDSRESESGLAGYPGAKIIEKPKAEELTYAVDLRVQRQTLAITPPFGGHKIRRPDPKLVWEDISLTSAKEVLYESNGHSKPQLRPEQTDPAVTMPLPALNGRKWPKSVLNSKLKKEDVLVRFIDFTVKPGHHYRYRLCVEYRNPSFRLPESKTNPFAHVGSTRLSTWSQPSNAVTLKNVTDVKRQAVPTISKD